jgi:DNA-3-methyladenine glycosylase
LYGPPGVAYVYLNYGIHYLVNAVTEPEGSPAAVLIRALEPLDGEGLMRRRRSRGTGRGPEGLAGAGLCRGPGNLTRALGITLKHNRLDLTEGPLRIEDRGLPARDVIWGTRVGISVGVEHAWRCTAIGSAAVSAFKAGTRASRRARVAAAETLGGRGSGAAVLPPPHTRARTPADASITTRTVRR